MEEDAELSNYKSVFLENEVDDEKVKDVEEKFSSLLKVITEDSRQLSEYLLAEENMISQICASLRKIFEELDLSVVLPKQAVPSLEKSREVILNSEGHLIIVQKDGTVESKSLEKYPPETVLMVVWGLIPKLREEVSRYMKKVSVRLNFLEMINEELKNIQRPFKISEEKTVGEFREERVKEILIPQK